MSDRRRYGENTTEMVPESLESVETGQAIQPKKYSHNPFF